MMEDRDPKYKENGETEGYTLRQLVVEIRQDVKDLITADSDHEKEGHGKHPTWPQVITLMVGVVTALAAFTALAG